MTTATVDLDAIAHNLDLVRTVVSGADVMGVVKADAYGHGMLPVAAALRTRGVNWLGVALPSEALTLRDAGDTERILAWLWSPGDVDIERCVATEVDLGVSNSRMLKEVCAAAVATGKKARVQLKVDTGVSRNGCSLSQWPALITETIEAGPLVEVTGVWSHLANADVPNHPSVHEQRLVFDQACASAEDLGLVIPMRHLANSPAALLYPETHYDLVRVGIGLYGVSPVEGRDFGLRPAMALVSSVASVKAVDAGASVSYGATWTATEETSIALVLGGYADGIPRSASNRAEVFINGRPHPIVGRVAMDQFMVALQGEARAGDEVIIFGVAPTANDFARACETIGYEIVTRIGPRVPRVYVGAP
ncbi:MAG: alanine racemase [Actinobacteria bacterium]|nr:MAG: alanine racemase [Actinomycetota bacterium]